MRYEPDPDGGDPFVVATMSEVYRLRWFVKAQAHKYGVAARHIPDIVQNAMIIAWRALDGRRVRGNASKPLEETLKGFLVVTVRHLARNEERLYRTKREFLASGADGPQDVENDVAGPDPHDMLEAREALLMLTRLPRVGAALLARIAYGVTLKEIEQETGIRLSTTHARLQKARKVFRRKIKRKTIPRNRKRRR